MFKFALLLLFSLILPTSLAAREETNAQTLVWPDGTRYVGGVNNGKRSGKGTIFWQDGTRFVGQFENDMRNGPGTMILPDGTVYTGIFKDDELIESAVAGQATDEMAPEQATADVADPVEREAESAPEDPVKTAPEVPVATLFVTDEIKQQLIDATESWRQAWSNKDVAGYLNHYAASFALPGKLNRSRWEALRRSRLNRPDYIKIQIRFEKFELINPDVVDVVINQRYESDLFSDQTSKLLRFHKENDQWKIGLEQSL